MNERSLYTYSMAKSLYDNRNDDILDILVPFVVLIVKNEGPEAVSYTHLTLPTIYSV